MSNPVEKIKNSLVSSEPVMAAHAAAAVVGYVLTFLVTHDVITNVQATALTSEIMPGAVALALLLLGWGVRFLVTPASKLAEKVEAEVQKRLGLTAEPVAPVVPTAPVAPVDATVLPAPVPPVSEPSTTVSTPTVEPAA
jgi:hypothetical protein